VFIGFKRGIKGYKIWDPKDKKFVLSRDVTFDEASMSKSTISQQVEFERTKEVSQQVGSDATSPSLKRSVSLEIIPKVTQGNDQVGEQDADDDVDQGYVMGDVHESVAVGRTRRNPRKPSWLTTDMIVAYALPVIEEVIPSTYRKAEISSESKIWKDAMEEEMSSLHENDTWKLTELPKRKKAIGCKLVYAKKHGSLKDDTIRYKARLVAKSCAQREGIDYNEVFSHIVKHSSIRNLLALVAQYELDLD